VRKIWYDLCEQAKRNCIGYDHYYFSDEDFEFAFQAGWDAALKNALEVLALHKALGVATSALRTIESGQLSDGDEVPVQVALYAEGKVEHIAQVLIDCAPQPPPERDAE